MNRGEVQKFVEQQFPGFHCKSHMAQLYRNSRIFILDLYKGQNRQKIVIKIARNYNPRQVAYEFENLSRFYSECKDPHISCPEPLFVDAERGIVAMRYVEGINLAHMLHEIRPVSPECLNQAVDLSARALAKFHSIFCWPEDEPITFDPTEVEYDINRCLTEGLTRIGDCNLQTRVAPYFDFTCWNIIIKDRRAGNGFIGTGDMSLYLIDFPRLNYICTPHLDLARFRFGLELVKQFPPAKFLGINRWDVDQLFDRFLDGYCQRMGVALNQDDLWLIGLARNANIRRARDITRKAKFGWQPKIENAYLRTFSRDWLDQTGLHAQWPAVGRAKKT